MAVLREEAAAVTLQVVMLLLFGLMWKLGRGNLEEENHNQSNQFHMQSI